MSQVGITSTKHEVAVNAGERFKAPRPLFQAPSNPHAVEATTPKMKVNVPSPSLAAQSTTASSELVKTALLAASQAAKTTVPATTYKLTRPRKEKVEVVQQTKVNAAPVFGPEDVCDARTFIIRTRNGDYHTPEMKRLFWANGGERHMVSGLTYASAFENLRTAKLREIKK